MALIILADDSTFQIDESVAKDIVKGATRMIGVPDLAEEKQVSNQHIVQLYKDIPGQVRKIDPADLVKPDCSRYAFLPYDKYKDLAIGKNRSAKPVKPKKRKPKNTITTTKKKDK